MADFLIAAFCLGWNVKISLVGDPDRDNPRHPDLERLTDVDEVWAFCFRRVKGNQWRLLGRFVAKDHFVGLGFYRRTELEGQYAAKAFEAAVRWPDYLGRREPIRGEHWSDYLTGNVQDVYDTPF